MRAFDYAAPDSLENAVGLLAGHPATARPLAGGTDLITQVKEGRRQVDLVVDLKRIPALNRLEYTPGGGLTLGAAVPCVRLQEDAAVRYHYPVLVEVAALIGSYQIQGRASLGGNLCNASPSADGVPALIVLGAQALIVGTAGRRTVAVESFCTAPGRTVLEPGELLAELQVPAPAPRSGAAYQRFIPRGEMDIAVAGVGAALRLDEAGRVIECRIALAAVAPVPLRVPTAEAVVQGRTPTPALFTEAGAVAAAACTPITDVRGSADYRRHLVAVLTQRVLAVALDRAKGGQ